MKPPNCGPEKQTAVFCGRRAFFTDFLTKKVAYFPLFCYRLTCAACGMAIFPALWQRCLASVGRGHVLVLWEPT